MEGMNKWWKVEPAELKKEDGSDLSGTDLEDCLYGKMIEQTKARSGGQGHVGCARLA